MEKPDVRYAQLSDKQLRRLRKFEDKLGAWVLAVQPNATLADLTDEQLTLVRALEQQLGVVLLAFDGEEDGQE